MSHSLRVAQVARSIAEQIIGDVAGQELALALGGVDPDVVEAASLAHDLGHAPFGHIGEQVLDDVARTVLNLPDGFEGNAQTIRIATKLEKRSIGYDGMNFTAATRAALMKYPWKRYRQYGQERGLPRPGAQVQEI